MDIVEIRNLKKYFRDGPQVVKALDGIDLSIEKGKFTVIAGASGSGKTTLLNTIAGLYEPDEGTVIVDGLDLSKMGEEQLTVFRRRRIGFVFQGYNLIPELTIKENIVFPLGLDNTRPDAAYLSNLVHLLGLDNYLDAFPHMLSGGAQQCAAIARALITKPSIVLADEPTGSFDMKTAQNVAGLLKMTAAAFHQTLVVITHNPDLAQLADRAVRLQDGKIV
jgi:ABC-type antimicrobial peptide transport system, ATPase component